MRKVVVGIVVAVVLLCGALLLSVELERRRELWLEGVIECRSYRVGSKVAGRVMGMNLGEGDWVEKGDTLYMISTPELEAKLEQVVGLRESAQALDKEVEIGARVEQKTQARSLVQQAQAAEELARKSFQRVSNLYDEGVLPRQQYDESKAQLEAAEAQLRGAKAQYELVEVGATRQQKQAARGRVVEAMGAVSEVESFLKDALVVAPIRGEVSTLAALNSELVSSGFPVITLLDMEDVWATFNIREDMLPEVAVGEKFRAFVPALGREVELRLSYLSPEADYAVWQAQRTLGDFDLRSFEVRMRPTEAGLGLRPGMSVLIDWSRR